MSLRTSPKFLFLKASSPLCFTTQFPPTEKTPFDTIELHQPTNSYPQNPSSIKSMESSPAKSPPPTAPPATADVENPKPAGTSYGVSGILSRWRREDWLKRGSLASRGLGFLFSLLAFIIMASNSHGNGKNFDEYEEYR